MERQKLKRLRKTHGIYPMFSLLNILQLPVHLVYISMINRLAFNYEINPKILSDGMLWFTDLSSPDPTGILPVAGGIVMLLNILTTSTTNSSSFTRKIRRYFYIFPIISVPVWMTFPVVSLLAIVWAVCFFRRSICIGWRHRAYSSFCWTYLDQTDSVESLASQSTCLALSSKDSTQRQSMSISKASLSFTLKNHLRVWKRKLKLQSKIHDSLK